MGFRFFEVGLCWSSTLTWCAPLAPGVGEGKFPLCRARSCCTQESNLPSPWSHAVSIATHESGFPGMQKEIISLPSCWIYGMMTGLGARQLPLPLTLLSHLWEMLGSALTGEGQTDNSCLNYPLFALRPQNLYVCPKAWAVKWPRPSQGGSCGVLLG